MNMLTKVAVAVDGSHASWRALEAALEWLGDQGEVLIVDVKDIVAFVQPIAPTTYGGSSMASLETLLEEWDANAEKVREQAMAMVKKTGITAQWQVVTIQDGEMHAAQAFLEAAIKAKAQAVVAGRHHGSAWIEGLFGSFPRWLATHASLPVVIIPPSQDAS
ncbi:hypothetical protein CO251_09520 [Sulfobacillus sp. hq2]|nr:hypothetical protein CO251_09520 [Sulfobacillus sp. hq2]